MRGAEVSIYFDYASPYAYFLTEAISGFQAADEAGVFGVPTAAYAEKLFWGVDRLAVSTVGRS